MEMVFLNLAGRENGGFGLIEIMFVVEDFDYYKHNDFCQLSISARSYP